MTEYEDVFQYITTEKNNYRTARVPVTNNKDWNMYEHVERCTNVANAYFKRELMTEYDHTTTLSHRLLMWLFVVKALTLRTSFPMSTAHKTTTSHS